MNSSLAKYIYYALLIGFCCNIIRIYFQSRDVELIQDGVYSWYFQLSTLGNGFICFGAVSSFFLYRKYFPSYITICYLLMIMWVTIASVNDIGDMLKPNMFFSLKGIGTYLNFGIIFFVADTERFPKILKLFYYTTFAFIVAAFLNLAKVGFGASRKEYLTNIQNLAFYCMWVFPYFFLQEEENKKKNLINIATFLVITFLILCTGARSYLIICAIYLIAKFAKNLKSANGILAIVGLLVLAGAGYALLANSAFSGTFDSAVNNLSERSGEDTRSEQILDFLSQYDMEYLIQGVGPKGLWYWHGIDQYYGFLDNQILLMAWWAGLPMILTYTFFLVKSMYVKSEILLFQDIKGVKLILGIWIAACLGFAIYVTICCDLFYYFISFMIGLNACQYTQIIEPEED